MEPGGKRFNVQFNQNQSMVLDELAYTLGSTKTGVLQKALSLLQVASREIKQGNQIAIVKNNEILKEIVGL